MIFILGLFSLLLSSCGRQQSQVHDKANVSFYLDRVDDFSENSRAHQTYLVEALASDQSIPAGVGNFDCIFLNVMGDGIGSWSTHQNRVTTAHYAYIGSHSGMISPVDGGSMTATVMKGSQRIIQVVGVLSSVGCPSSPASTDLTSTTSFPAMYEIARTTVDVTRDITVDLSSVYSSSSVREIRYDLVGDAPTLSSVSPDTSTFSSVPTTISATFSRVMAKPSTSSFILTTNCTTPPSVSATSASDNVVTATLSGGSCHGTQTIQVSVSPANFKSLSGLAGTGSTVSKTYTHSY